MVGQSAFCPPPPKTWGGHVPLSPTQTRPMEAWSRDLLGVRPSNLMHIFCPPCFTGSVRWLYCSARRFTTWIDLINRIGFSNIEWSIMEIKNRLFLNVLHTVLHLVKCNCNSATLSQVTCNGNAEIKKISKNGRIIKSYLNYWVLKYTFWTSFQFNSLKIETLKQR